MIERIISSALEHRLLVVLIALLIAAWGVYSYLELPLDAFPDVTNIQVEVLSYAPGRAPLEVERFVTYPLEMSLRGLPGLDQLRSVSKFGLSVITAVFKDDVDVYFARQLVLERLIEARESLPEGIAVSLGPVSTAMGEIYQYTLEAPDPADEAERLRQLTDLRTLQDWVLSPLLKTVAGVSEVNSFGGYVRQYQVLLEPSRLLRHGIRLAEVVEALERHNRNAGGNVLDLYDQQYIIRGTGLMSSAETIARTVVKAERGVAVTVGDLGAVRIGHAVRQGASVKDGKKEVVGGIVMMLRGENSRKVVEAVQAKVREIHAGRVLPAGVRIEPFYERSDIIQASVGTVTRALREGAVLVVLVLFLFLRSVRGALIVVVSMPLSVLLTFIVMRAVGLTANLMSLGGLAISIGMIVDASIIQVENIQRHLAATGAGDRKLATVLKAVLEVRKPSIFGELIIIVTFLPIMTLTGIEGKMFSPLALTLAIALGSSLALSIIVIPVLCFYGLKPEAGRATLLMRAAQRVYGPVLDAALRLKPVVIAAAIVLLGAALLVYPRLGREFMPVMDEGAFDMDIQFLPGISLERSVELSLEVERELMKFPELRTIVSRTGQTGVALEARGVEKTGYVGALRPRREWTSARTREELTERFRQAVAHIPGMSFSFSQPIACRIDEIVSGARAQLIIKVFGDDMDVLKDKAGEIAAVVGRLRGAEDLNVERVSGQPTIVISADVERAARHGLGAGDVMDVVETAVGGKIVTQVYEGDRFFDLVVRYPEAERGSVEALRRLLVASPKGYHLPLSDVARIEEVEGPVQVSREFGRRRIGVECNVAGRDIGGFVEEAKARIAAEVDLPEGYYLTWGGQFENQQRAARRLSIILPATLGLVFLLLFFTFGELGPAVLVFLNLPFALVGGVAALYVSGQYLSVPASVGFIVLLGIAVLNGVVLVSHIRQLAPECATSLEATRRACGNRLRPVLMTAATTVFGLVPLLFAQGPGSEVQRPLAVVVIGGLVTSTALTLVVLPALVEGLARKKDLSSRP